MTHFFNDGVSRTVWVGIVEAAGGGSFEYASDDSDLTLNDLWWPSTPNYGEGCTVIRDMSPFTRLDDYPCTNTFPYICEVPKVSR